MTDEELQAIRHRSSKATAGPWKIFERIYETDKPFLAERLIGTAWDHPQLQGPDGIVTLLGTFLGEPHYRVYIRPENAEFIAHAREDIPLLLDEIEEWKRRYAELESLRQATLSSQQPTDCEVTEDG